MDEMKLMDWSKEEVVGSYVADKVDVTAHEVNIVLCNGLEGGIGYWACLDNRDSVEEFKDKPKTTYLSDWCTKIILEGKSIRLLDAEDHDVVLGELTLEKLINGIKLNVKNRDWDNDIHNGDATTADCIIQYAVFGDIVYG